MAVRNPPNLQILLLASGFLRLTTIAPVSSQELAPIKSGVL